MNDDPLCSVISMSIVPHTLNLTNDDVEVQLESVALYVRHNDAPAWPHKITLSMCMMTYLSFLF